MNFSGTRREFLSRKKKSVLVVLCRRRHNKIATKHTYTRFVQKVSGLEMQRLFTGWDVFATSLDMFVHVLATHDTSFKWLRLLSWVQQVADVTPAFTSAIFTMCERTEQRISIKFCFKIRKTATETYQLLQQAYGDDAMACTQVFDWFLRFKEGRTSVESNPRPSG